MSFKVAARAILELGAELISSDAIALYELIKNAIDADSESGVEIDYVVTLSARAYREFESDWESEEDSIDDWRSRILESIESDAPAEHRETLEKELGDAEQWHELWAVIERAYNDLSYIEIRDTGSGMTIADLNDAFLTIGTPSRALAIKNAIDNQRTGSPPSLGEKGVGRLSAMRLGDMLSVTTTTQGGQFWNQLEIDWRDFAKELGAMLEQIPVTPKRGSRKDDPREHGTTLRISRLTSNWSSKRLLDLASKQLARLADPFEAKRDKFPIRITFNGQNIKFNRYIRKVLFRKAHAIVKGRYIAEGNKGPQLTLTLSAPLYERSAHTETFFEIDILAISTKYRGSVPPAALKRLGDFEFDLYWFNRRRLKKPVGFESLAEFRKLLDRWLGIMLYRDGYQVLPYGSEDDDWLELDAQALKESGFKLNTIQFVGRVAISRLGNRHLIDQTNREGLRDCDEKDALIRILRFAIWSQLSPFLDESRRAFEQPEEHKKDNPKLRLEKFSEYRQRAQQKIRQVKPSRSEDRVLLREVVEVLGNLEKLYKDAEGRIEAAADERERLIDLAGVGLIIESLAHELTRTVEHSASVLGSKQHEALPPDVKAFFQSLKRSLQSVEKRLKILDPLSVSGRQRRRNLDLRRIVETVVASHEAQFDRHNIDVKVLPSKAASVPLFAVEGRIIQILENLISNSVYWLRMQKELKPSAESHIQIRLFEKPIAGFRFSDSGPGIPFERRERVFEPFYSTKEERARQGLGLYIARETAEFHGGTVYLDEEDRNSNGNLQTFVVEIPDTRKKRTKRR